MTIALFLCSTVAALAVMNTLATVRLWRSPLFEHRQKVIQTVLTWLIPGFFVLVRHASAADTNRSSLGDATAGNLGSGQTDPSGADFSRHDSFHQSSGADHGGSDGTGDAG